MVKYSWDLNTEHLNHRTFELQNNSNIRLYDAGSLLDRIYQLSE